MALEAPWTMVMKRRVACTTTTSPAAPKANAAKFLGARAMA